jgi:hypothetical protein
LCFVTQNPSEKLDPGGICLCNTLVVIYEKKIKKKRKEKKRKEKKRKKRRIESSRIKKKPFNLGTVSQS